MQEKHRLSYAQGYLELGMVAEAAAELEGIPASADESIELLGLRLAVLQEQGNWPALELGAAEFVRRRPEIAGAWITWAYAKRRSHSLAAAEQILRTAARLHPKEATIQFNLGCYACQRGDLNEARRRVDRAIELDGNFRALAATDSDLAPLRAAENADCPPSA
jgi:tetratricopeptide (TPR) repeat protein